MELLLNEYTVGSLSCCQTLFSSNLKRFSANAKMNESRTISTATGVQEDCRRKCFDTKGLKPDLYTIETSNSVFIKFFLAPSSDCREGA